NGSLFADKDGKPVNFIGDQNIANFMRYSGSWMTGVVEDTIYANKNSNWDKQQLWPGPIDTVTNLPKSAVEWSKVWTITRADVNFHRANFTTSGYTGSDFIKNWPAKHADNNISPFMAPYIDWNSNGVYDPENGDYPSFEGDYAAYFIANDLFGENIFPQANKIGVELQGLVYAYDRSDLKNTLFVKLFLINRSANDYAPFYFGQYVDYQLGNFDDNRIETDVNRNLVFGFNGDSFDENGFKKILPAAGCVFLNEKLFSSTSFVDSDSIRRLPINEEEMLNVMQGFWPNGRAKYAFGQGITGSNSQITKYIYPNETDPKVSQSWVDFNSNDAVGHRHGVGVIRYDMFKSKSYKRIDLAFVTAVDESHAIIKLRQDVDNAQAFFNQTLSHSELSLNSDIGVYPNPFVIGRDISFHIDANSAEMMDGTGKLVTTLEKVDKYENKFQIPCSEKLVPGVYYIKAVKSNSLSYKKVILISNN
ncbi:MAG: hypothetical protein ACI9UJ_000902, partial [bacterium]